MYVFSQSQVNTTFWRQNRTQRYCVCLHHILLISETVSVCDPRWLLYKRAMFSAVRIVRASRLVREGVARYCSEVGSKEYFDKLVANNKVVVFMKVSCVSQL